MNRLLILLLILVITSCNQGDTKASSSDSALAADSTNPVPGNDTSPTSQSSDTVKTHFEGDSVIIIQFPAGATSITVTGELKGIAHPVAVMVPIKQGKELSARITPGDSTANIRINQIFTPDGKADGPFGRDLKRAISQQGTYKLLIGENLMQGDEWKGKFLLTISVK